MDDRIKNHFYLRFKYFFLTNFIWRFYNRCQLFGLDFGWFLIGNRDFIYIEDCPDVYTIWESGNLFREWKEFHKKNKLIKLLYRIIFGPVYKNYVGTSKNVKKIIVTKKVERSYLQGKHQDVISLSKLWNIASNSKREMILSFFGITSNDIEILKSKKIVLFTQAFSEDKIMTEEEKIHIYSSILLKYDKTKVVIKKHPRDKTDYSKYIEGVYIFDKPCPAQLLDIIGIKYEKAITVSSTAVLSIPYPVDIEWVGNEIHPSLLKAYGHQDLSMH